MTNIDIKTKLLKVNYEMILKYVYIKSTFF